MKSSAARFRVVFLTISGFIGALLLFEGQVEQAIQNNLLFRLLVVVDLMKPELFVLALIIVVYPFLKNTFLSLLQTAKEIITYANIRSKIFSRNRKKTALISALIISSVIFLGYQGYYLTVGRYIYITNYHRVLIARGEEDFTLGNRNSARKNFSACIALLNSSRCEKRATAMEQNLALAESLQNLSSSMPESNYQGRILLAEDIYLLDRDFEFFNGFKEHIRRKMNEILELYIDGLEHVNLEDFGTAKERFAAVNSGYPGFGDSHILLAEINKLGKNTKTNISTTPFLNTVRQLEPQMIGEQAISRLPEKVREYMSKSNETK